jgi:hypothetical protein
MMKGSVECGSEEWNTAAVFKRNRNPWSKCVLAIEDTREAMEKHSE